MKKIRAERAKAGETWLVSIDDKLDLQKVLVEATYKNAVAIRAAPEVPEADNFFDQIAEDNGGPAIKAPPVAATRYIRWSDIDFVEKL